MAQSATLFKFFASTCNLEIPIPIGEIFFFRVNSHSDKVPKRHILVGKRVIRHTDREIWLIRFHCVQFQAVNKRGKGTEFVYVAPLWVRR
jgi:hypothetical protein